MTHWGDLDLDDLSRVIFVVQAVSQHVAESPESSLRRVGHRFLLGLMSAEERVRPHLIQSRSLALDVLGLSTPNILMPAPIGQSDTNDCCDIAEASPLVVHVYLE